MPDQQLPIMIGEVIEADEVGPSDVFAAGQWQRFVEWFWEGVDQSGGKDACWPWKRQRRPDGYGIIVRFLTFRANRMAWILTNGSVPYDLHILHSCDNPPCCNPSHLRAGTRSENMKDAYRRGRHPGNGGCKPRAKITQEQADEIRRRSHAGESRTSLANEFGLSVSGLDKVRKGISWGPIASQ